jgi:hypothetical protein
LDSLPVAQVPLVAIGPCQPPLATQSVAPVVFHVSVEFDRLLIVVGEADRVMVGAGWWVTTTCRDCVAEPPAPVQVRV